MVKKRENQAHIARVSADEFVSAVEEARPEKMALEDRIECRAKGRRFNIHTQRGTERQLALINYAAEAKGVSKQKLWETIVMPALEKEFGEHVPFD